MKTLIRIMIAACLAALTVSCTKENNEKTLSATRESISVSVAGLMGEYTPETKSELVNSVRVAWEGGENVYVYDEENYLGFLKAKLDGTDDRYAILSGTVSKPAGDKLFLVHSPILGEAPEITDGQLSISLEEQATDKAPFVVYATLDYNGEAINDVIVPFSFATSVIRVSCTGLNPNTAISSANVSGVNTSCVLSFSDGAVTASGADEGIITRLDANGFAKVNAEGDASFQFAVPALDSSAGRTLSIMQGENEYMDVKFSKASIDPNYSVNTICSMIGLDNFIHGKFTVNDEGKQVYFSKGNLQATYDGSSYTWEFAQNQYDIVGAGNEDIANPTNGTKLDLFGWSTASTYYGISTSTDNSDYKGTFVDWGRALGSNSWRTLSMDEWKYLVNERKIGDNEDSGYGYTCVKATIEGTDGLIIFCDDYFGITEDLRSIPEGCVFLPAAGRREINSTIDPETHIETATATKYVEGHLCYWSATPASGSQAHNFVSDLTGCGNGTSTRNFGYSVRLVTDCN